MTTNKNKKEPQNRKTKETIEKHETGEFRIRKRETLEDLDPDLETRGVENEWVGVDWRQLELGGKGERDWVLEVVESPAT